MNSAALFSKTPPVKLFFLASVPGAISMLASALYQTVDGVFVGQFLGTTAFAALNLAMPFVVINFSLADLIGVGSAVPISVCLGKKQGMQANNIFTCACLMIVAAGAVIGGVLYAAAPALIRLMGAEGEFAALAVQYLRVYALCSPVTTIVFAADNYLRICGYIRGSMMLNILMSCAERCAGISVSGRAGLGHLGRGAGHLPGHGRVRRRFLLCRFCAARRCCACAARAFPPGWCGRLWPAAAPTFLNNIAGRVTSILLNIILVRLGGETAVSVYGILMYADGFIQPLLYGMCDSLQPAVGYNWGAGQLSRVRAIEKCCFAASGVVSLAAAVAMALFPGQIAGPVCGRRRARCAGHGHRRAAPVQPDVCHALVLVCHAKLYAGH